MSSFFHHFHPHRERLSRRSFLRNSSCTLAWGAISATMAMRPSPADAAPESTDNPSLPEQKQLIWANLLHLSYNMWCDRPVDHWGALPKEHLDIVTYQPYLRFDERLWKELTERMAEAGLNMVVIDLGDGVQYRSHPEIAVRGAWSPEKIRKELARLRKLGLEPIPKLNFSAAHDAWLGPYARQVSTSVYYQVCEDLIEEVIGLFDTPRYFHLGFDEETAENQKQYAHVVIRQHELRWHDLEFLLRQVERRGVRPWIWTDYQWKLDPQFPRRMPRSVLHSNWYYGRTFSGSERNLQWFEELDRHGFDQVPTGSNWIVAESFGRLVDYCRKKLTRERLKGFLQAPWLPTLERFRQKHLEAIDQAAAAKLAFIESQRQGS